MQIFLLSTQDTDKIQTYRHTGKNFKENADFFAGYICTYFNDTAKSSISSQHLSNQPIYWQFLKIELGHKKIIIDQYVSCPLSQKSSRRSSVSNCLTISKIFFQIFSVVSGKALALNFAYYLLIIEKWKAAVDNKKVFGALLIDPWKVFDCISHDLLIANLNSYGLSFFVLNLIHNYFLNRKHEIKVGSSYSSWMDIPSSIPEGSILGPLLFNIFLYNLFLEFEHIFFANYADDTTPYPAGENTEEEITELTNISQELFKWFSDNQMKATIVNVICF